MVDRIVSIAGLSRAAVLAALFNAAEPPRRSGVLQFNKGPYVMTEAQAQQLLDQGGQMATEDYDYTPSPYGPLYFEYLYGRLIFVDLAGDSIDAMEFDQRSGSGATARAIAHLRETGEVYEVPQVAAGVWLDQVVRSALERYDEGDMGAVMTYFVIGAARHPATAAIATLADVPLLVLNAAEQGRGVLERVMRTFVP